MLSYLNKAKNRILLHWYGFPVLSLPPAIRIDPAVRDTGPFPAPPPNTHTHCQFIRLPSTPGRNARGYKCVYIKHLHWSHMLMLTKSSGRFAPACFPPVLCLGQCQPFSFSALQRSNPVILSFPLISALFLISLSQNKNGVSWHFYCSPVPLLVHCAPRGVTC